MRWYGPEGGRDHVIRSGPTSARLFVLREVCALPRMKAAATSFCASHENAAEISVWRFHAQRDALAPADYRMAQPASACDAALKGIARE